MAATLANRLLRPLVLAAFVVSWLTSCGGVDSGGTGSAAVGPITGYGSIIVNGVRFDDSSAAVLDDAGNVRSRDQLRLGVMTVVDAFELTGSAGSQRAIASTIRISSEIVGPVDAVDPAAGRIEVLGQTVMVTPATVFDAAGGLASLQVGTVVEVYGRHDAVAGRYAATRIERKSDVERYTLRGVIASVNAPSFMIGGQRIGLAQLPAPDLQQVVAGRLVRVTLQTSAFGDLRIATAVTSGLRQLPDRDDAQVEGRISAWGSSRQFSVDGMAVDAAGAAFPDGEGGVVLGARVEVEGESRGGVLYARVVKVEGDEDSGNSVFELNGPIETLDMAGRTLTLRGVVVDFSGNVQFRSGTASDLAVGRRIEVEGALSSDGSRVVAQEITFEDN